MSFVFRRPPIYLKTEKVILHSGNRGNVSTFYRRMSDEKNSHPEICTTTMLVENGLNVQELPIVIRKLRDLSEIERNDAVTATYRYDSNHYHLIQAEFNQCVDLRDVFTLLSKCTNITPNIALGAMERINDLERQPTLMNMDSKIIPINSAKGAILDKLLKVVMKTEDTQTILNVLNTNSSFMRAQRHKFSDELLLRAVDNKMSVSELCTFALFLFNNKTDQKYCDTLDKLWASFVDKEQDIDETNMSQLCALLSGLKASKRTMINLLEQKLSELWYKIKPLHMQGILDSFVQERYLSAKTWSTLSRWLYTNIHALDDDSLLDIITKFAKIYYVDDEIEKAIVKYVTFKGAKIESEILVVGILNYCLQFKIRNENVLDACSEYFLKNSHKMPHNFLKSFLCPYGHLYFDPIKSKDFWIVMEDIVCDKFERINSDDLCSIILSFIYVNKYPLKLVNKVFSSENLVKIKHLEVMKKLQLIDTSLSLECDQYSGPRLPKDQWSGTIVQECRIRNIIKKTQSSFEYVAGGSENMSTSVLIPHLHADRTYLIDIMIHPVGLGSSTFNWKVKSTKNENIAILIHLPDHYCSDNQLIGPQMMRKKHLKLLGFKVVSLPYIHLSNLYREQDITELNKYLKQNIENAECVS